MKKKSLERLIFLLNKKLKKNENKKGTQITLYTIPVTGYASDGSFQDDEINYIIQPYPIWAEEINKHRYYVAKRKYYGSPVDAAARNNSVELLCRQARGPYNLIGVEEISLVGRRGMVITSDYPVNKFLDYKDGGVVETVPINQEEAAGVVIHEYNKMPCNLYLQNSPSEPEQFFSGSYSWTTDYLEGVWLNTTIYSFPDLEPNVANIKALKEYLPMNAVKEYKPN
jgi:hypothetical protein